MKVGLLILCTFSDLSVVWPNEGGPPCPVHILWPTGCLAFRCAVLLTQKLRSLLLRIQNYETLSLSNPGVGRNIPMHLSPAAKNSILLIFALLVPFITFFPDPLQTANDIHHEQWTRIISVIWWLLLLLDKIFPVYRALPIDDSNCCLSELRTYLWWS